MRAARFVPTLWAVDAASYGVVGRVPAFPVLTVLVLSTSSGPIDLGSYTSSSSGGRISPRFSQHSILFTRIVDCCLGVEHLAQLFLQVLIHSLGSLAVDFLK